VSRPRGPLVDWRPQARTRELLAQVDTVLVEYADHLPLTIRQVFYRLVGKHGYDKTERAYERLAETLGRARRAGIVAMAAIRDDGVTEESTWAYTGKPGFLDQVVADAEGYRLDRRAGQTRMVEVWCEAAGMVPQLARVAGPYGIPVYSSSGFDSLTAKHACARRAEADGRPLVVLHIGDHDPSGVHVFSAAAEDVASWAAHYGAEVRFARVAVTPAQVETYGLPTAPVKTTDRRVFAGQTTQAEALDPATLAAIVEAAIRTVTDLAVLAATIDREDTERAELLGELSPWR